MSERDEAREKIAKAMIACSLATGRGETTEALQPLPAPPKEPT